MTDDDLLNEHCVDCICEEIFFLLHSLWGPPSLLPSGYRGLHPQGYSGRDVLRLRMVELYSYSPTRHGIVLN
jgi:hypothetical protein